MTTLLIILGFILLAVWAGLTQPKNQSINKPANNENGKTRKYAPVMKEVRNQDGSITLEVNWPDTFLLIERAVHYQDYEFARTWLQKFAYNTVNKDVEQSVRDKFKRLMTAFCREDPLYRQIMQRAVPIVTAQPGMLQAALYPQLPGYSEEQIRYALYFAHELGDLSRLKKGRSYQLFGPTQTVYNSPNQVIGQAGQITLTSRLEIRKNPIDEKIAALHREATANKKINWDKAIACLQEAQDLMRRHSSRHETARWMRLPDFLQQAGRFDEAMQEFERLLKEVKPRIEKETSGSRYAGDAKMYTHLAYCQIYGRMGYTCKKQKMTDKALEYQDLSERHRLVFDELKRVADLEMEKELDAFKRRRQ